MEWCFLRFCFWGKELQCFTLGLIVFILDEVWKYVGCFSSKAAGMIMSYRVLVTVEECVEHCNGGMMAFQASQPTCCRKCKLKCTYDVI